MSALSSITPTAAFRDQVRHIDTRMAARLIIALAISVCVHGIAFESLVWVGGNSRADSGTHGRSMQVMFVQTATTNRAEHRNEGHIASEAARIWHASGLPEPAASDRDTSAEETDAMPSRGTPGSVFGPWYFTSRYLHRRPSPRTPVQPIYPADAENTGGRVLLLLYIGDTGKVDQYEIIESIPGGVFDKPVIEAFASMDYQPGVITGYSVRSQLLVEVTFDPGKLPQAATVAPD